MKKILRLLSAAALFAASVHATTYYTSSSRGTDTNSGLSPAQPWRTIARVNGARFSPGDSVLFKRGDLWRETLQPSSSGTREKRITYGAYGSGPKPVISGNNLVAAHEIQAREVNIDNHEQSHILYDNLDLRHAREGLRLYSWRAAVTDVVLQNSSISTERSAPHGFVPACVYENVNAGSFSEITIQNNVCTPYPAGLEHWGVYFVRGVSGFKISGNRFAPAGEDDITIWHSERGLISDNSGGGNGENTIDVKDSHDIIIRGNRADGDGEYNIVVHAVDSGQLTYNVSVENNQCNRGGQAGELTAGIALLFTRESKLRNNLVQEAYGAGVFINDKGIGFRNEISGNFLKHNGTRQRTGAITLEDVSDTEVHNNSVYGQGLQGFALRLEGGPHTRVVRVTENTFFSEAGRMLDVVGPAALEFSADNNVYYADTRAIFRWASQEYSFAGWRAVTQQDAHSRLADPASFQPSQLSSRALSK